MADLYQNKINQYIGDIARSAKFTILMNPPSHLNLGISMNNNSEATSTLTGSDADEAIEYFCYAGAFPGFTGEVIDFKYHGRTIPIPSAVIPNQTFTATFYNDENHGIRKFFKDWIEATQMWKYSSDDPNSRTQGYDSSYIALYQWDYELKNKTVVYALFNAFPVSMSDIEVSYESINQVQNFTVEFRYSYFDMGVIEGQASSAQDIKALVKNTINNLKSTAISAVKDTLKSIGSQLYESVNSALGIEEYINKKRNELSDFFGDTKGFFNKV